MNRLLLSLCLALVLAACERDAPPDPIADADPPAEVPPDAMPADAAREPATPADDAAARLQTIIDGDHRSDEQRARDRYRNPLETLTFFGLTSDMTVVEMWPGGGWYTEIIAPYVAADGQYIAAHWSPDAEQDFFRQGLERYRDRFLGDPDLYGEPRIGVAMCPDEFDIAEPDSVDLVLTFRSLHNWMGAGCLERVIDEMHRVLRPGGTLGVVQHRARDDAEQDPEAPTGYVREDWAIERFEAAGFELVDRSEVNANPDDPADHEGGVWTLPPRLARGDEDRDRYLAIGESDRFTLKFRKSE